MADVFLSYARADKDRAELIKRKLEELGLSVFFDTEGLDGGDVFPDVLDREVKSAGAVVSVWTNHSINRPWVKKECQIGMQRKVLIPIQIEPISDLEKPVAFADLQFTDLESFDGDPNHPGWKRTVRALSRTLKRKDLLTAEKEREKAEKKAAAERAKREAELARLRKDHAKLKSRSTTKSGLGWKSIAAVLMTTLSLSALGIWWFQNYQANMFEDKLADIETRFATQSLDVENDPEARKLLADVLASTSVPRLTRAAETNAQAALLAGWAYHYGEGGIEQDFIRAVKYYRLSCEGGSLRGCRNLGHQIAEGEGVTEDDVEAVRLYKQACDGGDMGGCDSLGAQYANGEGVTEDDTEANRLFKKACDGGNMSGCFNLGVHYMNGLGVEEDSAEAHRLFGLACNGGYMTACAALGVQFLEGYGVEEDHAEGRRLFSLACNGGEMRACVALGDQFQEGYRVEEDDVEANRLYKKACDGGNPTGCSNLGNQIANGRGAPKDVAKGRALLKKGCDGGNQWGCNKLKQLDSQ